MPLNIAQINLHEVHMQLKYPFTTSFGSVQKKVFLIIEMVDEKGERGFGESVAFTYPWYTEETFHTTSHMIKDVLIPVLRVNEIEHPNDVTNLFKPIKRNHMAKAGLEGAVWDLYAKQKGIPLAQALGGKRKSVDVGVSLGIEKTTKLLLQKIEQYQMEGYKRIKVKIKPGNDVELLQEIRQHFPSIPLMVDANSAYTLADVDHLKKFDAFDLLMIEQPLADEAILDHATLQNGIQTPICLDESIHSYADARLAIELGSCKIINIKSGRVGGLTEAKHIHDLCKQNGIEVWCGGMLESGVGRAHNIALATLANFTLPGDISGSSRYFEKDIILPEVIVHDGVIDVPNQPGIGYDVNLEALDKFTKQTMVIDF